MTLVTQLEKIYGSAINRAIELTDLSLSTEGQLIEYMIQLDARRPTQFITDLLTLYKEYGRLSERQWYCLIQTAIRYLRQEHQSVLQQMLYNLPDHKSDL